MQGGRADVIPVRVKLLAWFNWVGTAHRSHDVEITIGVPASNFGRQGRRGRGIFGDVTAAMNDLLVRGKYGHDMPRGEINFPNTGEEQRVAMMEFERLSGLPGVIGAFDGTLIKTPKLPNKQLKRGANGLRLEEHKHWFCYKQFSAWLLLAVVDARGRFIYISNNHPGSRGDAAAWNRCGLSKALDRGLNKKCTFRIEVEGEVHDPDPYLLGDSAFAMKSSLLKIWPTVLPGTKEEAWNWHAIRTRRIVECAFGRLKFVFKILHKNEFLNDRHHFPKLIETLCALHNYMYRTQGKDYSLMPSSEWSAYRRGHLQSYIESPTVIHVDEDGIVVPLPPVDRGASDKRSLLAKHCVKVLQLQRGHDVWDADYGFDWQEVQDV